jgi:FG-GAP-like repeat
VPDIAFGHRFVNGFASVLLGNADGTFVPPARFSTGSNPASVAIGDLNVDGAPDLAVANEITNDVSVLPNTTQLGILPQLAGIAALIDSFQPPVPQEIAAGLESKLAEAASKLDKGKTDDACRKLDGFNTIVRDALALSEPTIAPGQANVLLGAAARVQSELPCS